MKYLIAFATILLLIVILKAQGCNGFGIRERFKEGQKQRQDNREQKKNDRRERREGRWRIDPKPNPTPDINPDKKRFMDDSNRRFFKNRRKKR